MITAARIVILVAAAGGTAIIAPRTARGQEGRPQVSRQSAKKPSGKIETNEDLQPTVLPPLPPGMTLDMIRAGDQLFHAKGGCFVCHGSEGQGMPAAGDAITNSLSYVQHDWRQIDSLITAGLPDAYTRSPIAMPPRGARSDLTDAEIQRIAAYVWAISAVRGEPWPGGHANHDSTSSVAAPSGTAPKPAPRKSKLP
jgi:mono/diheme cytochrome c family protein